MIELSVVIICKNQEWNIARLVESVLDETETIVHQEIIVVDSASTDRTVDIACKYPINVIKLLPDQVLTAAAGRYVGSNSGTGQFVFFLDGDMELHMGWLNQAMDLMHKHPDVAAVTGQLIDLPKSAQSNLNSHHKILINSPKIEIPYAGGTALYRRSILEEVGHFNPFLYSDEEPDLCIRIRHAGYRIMKIQYPVAYHYSDPAEDISTKLARWRRNLYLGAGQNLRYHLGKETFATYVKERGYGLIPGVIALTGILGLILSIVYAKSELILSILLLLFLVLLGDAYRKRSLYKMVSSFVHRWLILFGTIRGFLMPPITKDKYLGNLEIVKKVKVQNLAG